VRRLAEALQQQGHQVSRTLVAELLNATGYSLQGNRKTTDRGRGPGCDRRSGRQTVVMSFTLLLLHAASPAFWLR
jgi:hypothetical protein